MVVVDLEDDGDGVGAVEAVIGKAGLMEIADLGDAVEFAEANEVAEDEDEDGAALKMYEVALLVDTNCLLGEG